jgi:DNA-binding XRE family transcriptional regulator
MPYPFDPESPVSTVADLPAGVHSADGKVVNLAVFGQLVVGARALLGVTRNDVATATNIHHSTLKKIEDGEFADLDRCAKVQQYLEHEGIEFMAGTREIVLRYNPDIDKTGIGVTIDPTMPQGMRIMHPRALDLDDLLSLLKGCGVQIEGEDTLRGVLEIVSDWCGMLVRMSAPGNKTGVRFTRPAEGGPTERGLVEQLRAFPFADDAARRAFIRNIVALRAA